MTERTGLSLSAIVQVAWMGLVVAALYGFLQDFMSPDWRALILAPLLLVDFRGAVSATREGSAVRAALWQGALIVVPFTGIYGLLDVVFSSDGPVWLLTPIIVGGLWLLFAQIVDLESD